MYKLFYVLILSSFATRIFSSCFDNPKNAYFSISYNVVYIFFILFSYPPSVFTDLLNCNNFSLTQLVRLLRRLTRTSPTFCSEEFHAQAAPVDATTRNPFVSAVQRLEVEQTTQDGSTMDGSVGRHLRQLVHKSVWRLIYSTERLLAYVIHQSVGVEQRRAVLLDVPPTHTQAYITRDTSTTYRHAVLDHRPRRDRWRSNVSSVGAHVQSRVQGILTYRIRLDSTALHPRQL